MDHNELMSAMHGCPMIKPYPSEMMPKSALSNLDMAKYNHRIDCPCSECEMGRNEAGTKVK